MEHTKWYKDAIVYQIYPRSFCDSNGDGMGDIKGIISKLDYLKELGINAIWLSPVYDSPQKDNGYDIANYRDIYPPFGNLDDMKELIKGAHDRGIKIIMDLVVNHTSDQHQWFQEALKNPSSKYRDYYYFKKGKKNGKKPPNNWSGFFGEKAWQKVPGEDNYYLRLFAKEQPDLNWENPMVRQEVIDILRYWLDMGVDGFRCDVITLISKKQDFKNRFPTPILCGKDAFVNGPRLHEYLHLLYEKAYADYDTMTVGETVMSTLEQARELVDPNKEELDMVFNFDHTDVDNYLGVKYIYRKFKPKNLQKAFTKWQHGLFNRGWNSLFIENHDQRRSVGRFGTSEDEAYRKVGSKMLATTYFLLQGTPFIYQGQEIGMKNADFTDLSDFKDVEIHNMYALGKKNKLIGLLINKHMKEVSRDNARTPMQWDDSVHGGFSTSEPWIKVNKNKDYINVKESLEDKDSIFHYYQKLIAFRKGNEVIKEGKYIPLIKNNRHFLAYEREYNGNKLLVISSFSQKEKKNPLKKLIEKEGYKLVLSNYDINLDNFKAYETRVYQLNSSKE